jgi:xanthine dehydrogenase YagS FAD-binding subunit
MKNFYHYNAKSVAEAVSLLKEYAGKAKVTAGGTDLLGVLQDRILPTQPEALINLKTIPGLDAIKEDAEGLKLGALAKLADIAASDIVKGKYAALAEAAGKVASPQLRNQGTIGGNICQDVRCWYYRLLRNAFYCLRKGGAVCYGIAGDNRYLSIYGGPAGCYAVCPSDTATALMALNATIKTSARTIPIGEFYIDTAPGNVLKSDEIVTEIAIPTPAASNKQKFLKHAQRKSIDFPIVNVAVYITPATGAVTDARIALGAVAPKPIRATDAEAAVKGKTITADVAEAAATAAVAKAVALTMNKYKIQITKALIKRALLA